MAELIDYQRLRMALGLRPDDESQIDNGQAELLFVQAGETYTDAGSITVYTRVLALDSLLMQAANDVDYTQNKTTEKASQRYAMLSKERDKWQKRLEEVIDAARSSAARFGRTKRKPARIYEYPGEWYW